MFCFILFCFYSYIFIYIYLFVFPILYLFFYIYRNTCVIYYSMLYSLTSLKMAQCRDLVVASRLPPRIHLCNTKTRSRKRYTLILYFSVTNTHDNIRSESPVGWWVSQAAAMSSPTPSPTAQSHQPNYSCMDEASYLLNRVLPRYVTRWLHAKDTSLHMLLTHMWLDLKIKSLLCFSKRKEIFLRRNTNPRTFNLLITINQF